MATIDIPDRVCSHCGGTIWYYDSKYNRYVCVQKRKEWQNKWRKENIVQFREKRRVYYHTKMDKVLHYKRTRKKALSNPEREREYKRKYSTKPEAKQKKKEYKKQNPDRISISNLKYKTRIKSTLGDTYLKELICQNTLLKHTNVPQDLVELKRKQLLLKRQLKTIQL